MRMIKMFLIGGAGLAALATAAPSTAQYYQYGYQNPYAYNQYGYGYQGYGMNTSALAQQCTAAVQNRLYYRNTSGVGNQCGPCATRLIGAV